jgi:hypothetical protein
VRIANADVEVVVRYGDSVNQERHALLKELHKAAVDKAWEREADMAAVGAYSLQDWTAAELSQLTKRGKVNGYHAAAIHSIHEYPDLVDDPANVLFVKNVKNRRTRRRITKYRLTATPFTYS